MAAQGSFAQRMAHRSSMATAIENWDDDGDFDSSADLFSTSISTRQSMSSHVSVRSESNTGDEDWQVLIAPNDQLSTLNAITSAKIAGIPIPTSVPSSALLGGSIKRLGKKPSNRKINVDDDWGNDIELPTDPNAGLKLKLPIPRSQSDDTDDFDDWGEGSLGIRFAGTRRETRGARSSSVSAMSPSMGSIMTLESEDDDLNGLVLPTEPLDFNARLEKLKRSDPPTSEPAPLPPQQPSPQTHSTPQARDLSSNSASPYTETDPASLASPQTAVTSPSGEDTPVPAKTKLMDDDDDDFLDGLDLGGEDLFDTKKSTLNRNVVVKKAPSKTNLPPAARPTASITFTDKSTSRIPRPLPSTASRSRLTPLYESGASQINNNSSRPMPTTTSAQYLRAKRSAPALRNNPANSSRGHLPFLPAGGSNGNSHHVVAKTSSQQHLRRDSDPRRPLSPPTARPYSRMSTFNPPDTPSRSSMRRELAPSAIARNAPLRGLQPKPRKQAWSGNELEGFDDLPTSATKEKQFEKVPRNVASNKTLRSQASSTRLPMPDRNATPQPPQTPRSPPKIDNTPRFARDTAASRNAREQRLAGIRTRGDGPVGPPAPGINWKVHVANRSPHTSPTATRKKGTGQKPQLIQAIFQPYAKTEKGMVYNPITQRWEGNEEALSPFTQHHPNTSTTTLALTTASTPTFAPPSYGHSHDRSHSISHTALSNIQNKNISSRAVKVGPVPSPPRPALIAQKTMPRDVKVEGGMIFDPVKMTWLKARRVPEDPRSPSVDMDDEEDPFAGLDDLKDNESVAGHGAGGIGGNGTSGHDDPVFVGEEFDLGPSFIRRQREEEAIWRRRVEGWVGAMRDPGERSNGGWRWAIRNYAASASAAEGW